MPASEARVKANRMNAALSTGPKTDEGKARSRGNAVKHGLTGEGVALPAEEAAEVERLQKCFEAEMQPSGQIGRALTRRMALMSVRMDRCVVQETAAIGERIRQAQDDFDAEWPEIEGEDDPDREWMRVQAGKIAMFDPSREATLARKYEAAAERGFFRALKELRQVEKEAKANGSGAQVGAAGAALGSFLPEASLTSILEEMTAAPAPKPSYPGPKPVASPSARLDLSPGRAFDIPFAIGRAG